VYMLLCVIIVVSNCIAIVRNATAEYLRVNDVSVETVQP